MKFVIRIEADSERENAVRNAQKNKFYVSLSIIRSLTAERAPVDIQLHGATRNQESSLQIGDSRGNPSRAMDRPTRNDIE
jgi:hypothetical protein